MIETKIVHSENPKEHWSDIQNVEGKIVMDLGCGWLFQEHESTPEYFINRGAKHLIGVEAACGEIEKLEILYPTQTFICKTILTAEDLKELFNTYKPEVIKMDIEGYESVINEMSSEDWSSVEEIGVEYHNPTCKSILETKLVEFGFEITNINQFGWFVTDTNIMGILHAKRTI
jgi:hypothetical protein